MQDYLQDREFTAIRRSQKEVYYEKIIISSFGGSNGFGGSGGMRGTTERKC